MAPKGKAGLARTKLSVNLDDDLLAWLESHCGPGKEFDSIRHGLERGIVALQEKMK